jgi:phosphoribosylformylglycinamidine synthase II
MTCLTTTIELNHEAYKSYELTAVIDDTPGPHLLALLKSHKISQDEFSQIKAILKRPPTLSELGIFSAMWSEHCSYKSSRLHLKRLPTQGEQVVVGPGENAGVIRISGKLCVAFKMESHNHPSYIEPYNGAATGVGGILRDVFCMGARPFANLNSLRFGEKSHPRTAYLIKNAVRGIGHYGNCVGVPTVGGSLSFDASYNGNCLVNAMTLGTIHEDRIFKGFASGPGNLVVYVGSATGRDGIHGATMASDRFDGTTQSKTTIQVGDPFKEKLLLEATLEVLEKDLVIGLQDMGAAGLTSSSFEMAGRAGNGLILDLERVPVRTTRMSAYELLLSESQERMLMVIKPECWEPLKEVLDKWLLDASVIGVVTDTGRVQVYHHGRLEADIPVAPITDKAPQYSRPIKPRPSKNDNLDQGAKLNQYQSIIQKIEGIGYVSFLKDLINQPGDYLPIHHQYDKHIQNRTVHGPDDGGAAVLWMKSDYADPTEPWLGVSTAVACNQDYCRIDPYWGAAHAVIKTARMIAAAGGKGLAITDCLNYGNPENPEVMWEISQGIDGIAHACQNLNIPVVSGNVSLYNETNGTSIAPTPMIGMVGKVQDVRKSPGAIFTQPGGIYLLSPYQGFPTFGGSLAAKLLGINTSGEIPEILWDAELESLKILENLTKLGAISSCRDIGQGGILHTTCKMFLQQRPSQADFLNVTLDIDLIPRGDSSTKISDNLGILKSFGERSGSYLLVLKEDKIPDCSEFFKNLQFNRIDAIGKVTLSTNPILQWMLADKNLFSIERETLQRDFEITNKYHFEVN